MSAKRIVLVTNDGHGGLRDTRQTHAAKYKSWVFKLNNVNDEWLLESKIFYLKN